MLHIHTYIQISNMSNISFVMGMFSYQKTSRNEQWVHLFSMAFDDFLTFYLIFWSKSPFFMVKLFFSGYTISFR